MEPEHFESFFIYFIHTWHSFSNKNNSKQPTEKKPNSFALKRKGFKGFISTLVVHSMLRYRWRINIKEGSTAAYQTTCPRYASTYYTYASLYTYMVKICSRCSMFWFLVPHKIAHTHTQTSKHTYISKFYSVQYMWTTRTNIC